MKAELLRQTLIGLAGCLLILPGTRINADTIQLNNGDRISGKLQRLGRSECILSTDFQSELRIPLRRIVVLQTDHAVSVNLNSGERIDGLVNIHFKRGEFKIRSERFGSINLSTEDVASLSTPNRVAIPEILPEQSEADEQLLASIQGRGAESPTSAPSTGSSEKIGAEQEEQQEEEQVRQVFLRASGVLLAPGDIQLETSLNYAREEQSDTFLQNRIFSESRVRTFVMPFIGRIGILPGMEGFLNVPIQYQERDLRLSANTVGTIQDNQSSLFSLGDVRGGLKYAFHRENSWPEVIGTFDFRAPTGRVRNPLLASASVTGSGQWGVAGGVNLIKSFDPVILFGGVRYVYNIFDEHNGIKFGSWSDLGYNMGLGFAVNNRVTLVGQFQGNYQTERSFSGASIGGGIVVPDREIATLRGGFTYKLASKQYIEPSVTFGLTDISPDLVIGLSYNRRL